MYIYYSYLHNLYTYSYVCIQGLWVQSQMYANILNMHWLIANYIVNCDWIYKNRPYGHM